jgi:hypothetical protein
MVNAMSNNNVALETVSTVALVAPETAKAPKGPRQVDDNVSEIALGDAVKAAKGVDKLSWNFATATLAMKLESIARAFQRGDNFPLDEKDASKVPAKVKTIANLVQYTLEAKAVHSGIVVYVGTENAVQDIRDMPYATKEQKAERKTAALLVADASWFHNGRPVPKDVNPAKDTSGKYLGAIQKARTNAFRTAKESSDFMLGHIFMNDPDWIRRNFVPADRQKVISFGSEQLKTVRDYVSDIYGDTFAKVEASRKAGRPPAKPRSDKVDSIIASAKTLKLDELVRLVAALQQMSSALVANARDADEATGDWDVADVSDTDEAPRTGTEG